MARAQPPLPDLPEITRRHFRAAAAAYDRGRSYEQWSFWAQELARLARLEPQDSGLDLSCSTGAFLLAYVQQLVGRAA